MSTQTYQDINRSNPIADLLEMIARRGPELMRQGGGALARECMKSQRRTTQTDRDEIVKLHIAGKSLRQIESITGWTNNTVFNCIKRYESSRVLVA